MPKETFHNLAPAKKEVITKAFLYEFSHFNYEDASITSVVKSLGIAKGSIYQYFEDKMDLFLYLKGESEMTKMHYVQHVQRSDHPDFWSYYRELYKEGIKFDSEHPLKSRLLYNIAQNLHTSTLRELGDTWKKQALAMMEMMIQGEVDQGFFRDDVSVAAMAHFLYTVSASIGDYMKSIHGVDFDKSLESDQPILADKKDVILQSVDEYLVLIQNAFNKSII